MAALNRDRVTAFRTGEVINLTVATGVTCYAGALAVVKADGTVRPGIIDASAPSCVAVGRFSARATAGETVDVETGIFRWNNHATDTVTVASIGKSCYVTDDQTVAATSNNLTRTLAGIVVDVTTEGVWVASNPANSSANVVAAKIDSVFLGTVAMAGTGVIRYCALSNGTLSSFGTVTSAAITTGDATLTAAINGTGVTGGVQTIPLAGSAANVTKITSPTALNSFVAGDVLTFTVGGSAGGSAVAGVTIGILS